MKLSVNEVTTLAAKAARGVGAPPAQADDFGRAAAQHLGAGRALEDLRSALDNVPNGPIILFPLALLALAERAEDGRAQGWVDALNLPELLHSYVEVMGCAAFCDGRKVTLDLNAPAPRRPAHRIEIPEALAADWSALAARLLVPETEASRTRGAGAGITDND